MRERDDILHLANDFLAEASIEFGRPCREISDAAAQSLLRLRLAGERARAPERHSPRHPRRFGCHRAGASLVPSCRRVPGGCAARDAAPTGASLKEIADAAAADAEQQAIRRVLQGTKGNKSEAARLLRTDYKTLHLKMKQYGIPAAQFRDAATGA